MAQAKKEPEGLAKYADILKILGYATDAKNVYDAYNVYQAYQAYEKAKAANDAAGMAKAQKGMKTSTPGMMDYAIAGWNSYNISKNDNLAYDQKSKEIQKQFGMALASGFTFGIAPIVDKYIVSRYFGDEKRKLENNFYDNQNTATFGFQKSFDKKLFGKKEADQIMRDKMRKNWVEQGVITPDWKLQFSDGSEFDMGKDGGAKLTNAAGESRRYKDVDFSDPFAADAAYKLQGLSGLMGANRDEAGNVSKFDPTGYWVNAVTKGATSEEQVNNRIKEVYGKFGIKDAETGKGIVDELLKAQVEGAKAEGKEPNKAFSPELAEHYKAAFDRVFGPTTTKDNKDMKNQITPVGGRIPSQQTGNIPPELMAQLMAGVTSQQAQQAGDKNRLPQSAQGIDWQAILQQGGSSPAYNVVALNQKSPSGSSKPSYLADLPTNVTPQSHPWMFDEKGNRLEVSPYSYSGSDPANRFVPKEMAQAMSESRAAATDGSAEQLQNLKQAGILNEQEFIQALSELGNMSGAALKAEQAAASKSQNRAKAANQAQEYAQQFAQLPDLESIFAQLGRAPQSQQAPSYYTRGWSGQR